MSWPPKELSPNARVHWAKKSKAAKAYRAEAFYKTKQALDEWHAFAGAYKFNVKFYPPDKRRRDDDNLIAQLKPARDGIADALGIDDSQFTIGQPKISDELGGIVEIIVEEIK